MVRKAIDKKLFKSYLIGKKKVEVNILQYVDDTIFMGDVFVKHTHYKKHFKMLWISI